jgi:hypothetical protein
MLHARTKIQARQARLVFPGVHHAWIIKCTTKSFRHLGMQVKKERTRKRERNVRVIVGLVARFPDLFAVLVPQPPTFLQRSQHWSLVHASARMLNHKRSQRKKRTDHQMDKN